MSDQTPEGGGPFPSPGEVDDVAHFESAPRPRQQRAEHSGPHLAFEATPRTPLPPVPSPAEARVLNAAASVAPVEPPPSTPAFEATPRTPEPPAPTLAEARVLRAAASVAPVETPATAPRFEPVPAAAQPRPSAAAVAVRSEMPGMTVVTGSGGPGWNVRDRDEDAERLRANGPQPPPAWTPTDVTCSGDRPIRVDGPDSAEATATNHAAQRGGEPPVGHPGRDPGLRGLRVGDRSGTRAHHHDAAHRRQPRAGQHAGDRCRDAADAEGDAGLRRKPRSSAASTAPAATRHSSSSWRRVRGSRPPATSSSTTSAPGSRATASPSTARQRSTRPPTGATSSARLQPALLRCPPSRCVGGTTATPSASSWT